MIKRWLALIAVLIFSGVTLRADELDHDHADQHTIIVKFFPGRSTQASLQSAGVRHFGLGHASDRADRFSQIMEDYAVVNIPNGMTVAQALALYGQDPNVEEASPNVIVHAFLTPNDSSFASAQWNFHNTGQTINGTAGTVGADIAATQAWDVETGTSHDVIVAVLDSGIDYTHPDLAGNMWTNPGEIAGNGVDDDGDGIIDDVHGANFVNAAPSEGGSATGDPMDDFYHGTHVAGIIGAVTNNAAGVAGTAWHVKLMAVKFLKSDGTGTVADAILGIQYAVAHGANIINDSWGTTSNSAALASAVTAAKAAGVIQVAAAGNTANSSVINYPAGYPEVIAVSATDNKDGNQTLNFGPHVALGAPGVDILSTTIGGGYITASGTSMAAPHVSGTAALMLAHSPSLTPDQARSFIVNSIDVPTGWNANYGVGRLNAFKALKSIDDVTPPTVAITTPTDGAVVNGTIPISADASDDVTIRMVRFLIDGVFVSSRTGASPYSFNYNTTQLSDGSHTILARAFDGAGHVATSTSIVTVANGDTIPPTVSVDSPTDGSTVAGLITLSATASDNVGVAKVWLLEDGVVLSTKTTPPYAISVNTGLSPDGLHHFAARAFDLAGNSTRAGISVTFNNVDTTSPTVHMTAPADGATISGDATLTASATDNLALTKVQFLIDNVIVATITASPYTTSINTLLYTEGPHAIAAKAFDGAGNRSSDTIHVTVVHTPTDLQPPTVTITSPANGTHVTGTIAVTANATDNVSVSKVELFVDGTLIGTDTTAPYSISWNADSVPSGNHVLLVKAHDPTDNIGTAQITVNTGGAAGALGLFQPLFNPARGESISIPLMTMQVQHVKARIIDRTGADIVTVVDADLAPGASITWDGRNGSHSMVASGTYLMLLDIDGKIETKKIIVHK